jgi:hypothetical protein
MALRPGWIIGFLMAWFAVQIMFGITEMVQVGAGVLSTSQSTMQVFMTPHVNPWDYVVAFYNMAWWNYAFLEANMLGFYVQMFLRAITAGLGVAILIMVFQILPSLLSGIAKFFPGA